MSGPSTIRRREVLRGMGATAGALALAQAGGCGDKGSRDRVDTQLVALIPDPRAARALGEEYRRLVPEEDDRARLVELIVGDHGPKLAGPGAGASIRGLIQEDFGAGRVVHVHGWIVSRTEARLAALASLG